MLIPPQAECRRTANHTCDRRSIKAVHRYLGTVGDCCLERSRYFLENFLELHELCGLKFRKNETDDLFFALRLLEFASGSLGRDADAHTRKLFGFDRAHDGLDSPMPSASSIE